VLSDPGDNEFCVIEAGNGFLAGLRSTRRGRLRRLSSGWGLLARGSRMAAGVGSGSGNRDPVVGRRHQTGVGRAACGSEARAEPPTVPPGDWRTRYRDREADIARGDPPSGRRRGRRVGRPGRQRVPHRGSLRLAASRPVARQEAPVVAAPSWHRRPGARADWRR
jgi:hypothetical protein